MAIEWIFFSYREFIAFKKWLYKSKAVTMDHFFLKVKGCLLNKSFKIHMDNRKFVFKENLLGGSNFSTFSKGQK